MPGVEEVVEALARHAELHGDTVARDTVEQWLEERAQPQSDDVLPDE